LIGDPGNTQGGKHDEAKIDGVPEPRVAKGENTYCRNAYQWKYQ
jgi:hypothetical protein